MFKTIEEYINFYESMTAPEYVRLQESMQDETLFTEGSTEDYEKGMKLIIGQALSRIFKGKADVETLKEDIDELKKLNHDDYYDDVVKMVIDALDRVFWLLKTETI